MSGSCARRRSDNIVGRYFPCIDTPIGEGFRSTPHLHDPNRGGGLARIRDLVINAIPGTMRHLEIGPGAAYEIQAAEATPYLACAATNCEQCVCDGNSTKAD